MYSLCIASLPLCTHSTVVVYILNAGPPLWSHDRVGLTYVPTATVVYSVRSRRGEAAGGGVGAKYVYDDEYEYYHCEKFSWDFVSFVSVTKVNSSFTSAKHPE